MTKELSEKAEQYVQKLGGYVSILKKIKTETSKKELDIDKLEGLYDLKSVLEEQLRIPGLELIRRIEEASGIFQHPAAAPSAMGYAGAALPTGETGQSAEEIKSAIRGIDRQIDQIESERENVYTDTFQDGLNLSGGVGWVSRSLASQQSASHKTGEMGRLYARRRALEKELRGR